MRMPFHLLFVFVCSLLLLGTGCPELTGDPELKGTFISGHLGNYESCPEDGYSDDASGGEPAGAPAEDVAADCAEDSEDCGGVFLNCEDAQVTLRLINTGDEPAVGVQVTRIELFDTNGVSKAVLPLMGVSDVTTPGATVDFEGVIPVGAERALRVDFQGPQSPWELLATDGEDSGRHANHGGIIEITFTAENRRGEVVVRGEVSALPSMAT
ncbi:hypothetical protein EA187_19055 [Lujinxingia sediminis]|uniref:Uncharacterized protein n=1 Tax=Lujinxingia sediminis TaxID=2480984 RepID=A0ABY0CNL6_9DELT|nr:hypothetical protein [Lujinxingia sediminis]RVU41443.1 hypothetical protein EA187_19055 [Lujinxingia sediminis]